MRTLSVIIFCGFVALAISNFAADQPRDHSSTLLDDAVKAFNDSRQAQISGKNQPPLTEDEVVAAIRGWVREYAPPATDEVYEAFQTIAETRVLPRVAKIQATSGWQGYRGFHFDVWWIDLTIPTDKLGYTFRIRSQTIGSRPLTEKEQQRITEASSEHTRAARKQRTSDGAGAAAPQPSGFPPARECRNDRRAVRRSVNVLQTIRGLL
jgi:hypothetical protein